MILKTDTFQVLTMPQRIIFDEVKAFVLSHRKIHKASSMIKPPDSLTMPNAFPARERKFIATLAADLHLDVSWDEYDDEDQNLVIFRIPGIPHDGNGTNGSNSASGVDTEELEDEAEVDEGENGQWEDVPESESSDDDAESNAAIDRVLKKYQTAKVVEEEEEDFDTRHERAVQDKMDEWKRAYYRVCYLYINTEGDIIAKPS